VAEGVNVGTLTSGNYSPVLERGIGLGLLSGDLEPGTPVSVAFAVERSRPASRRCPSFEGEVTCRLSSPHAAEIDEMLTSWAWTP